MPIVEKLEKHKLVFDTHVLLWHMGGHTMLSPRFRTACQHIQKETPILVSPITIWEISLLVEKKRLHLEMDCLDWFEQALLDPGFQLAPITPSIAVLSTRLPGSLHGDPADRLQIATTFEHHAVLVTCDEKILEYGQNHFINVHDPRR